MGYGNYVLLLLVVTIVLAVEEVVLALPFSLSDGLLHETHHKSEPVDAGFRRWCGVG